MSTFFHQTKCVLQYVKVKFTAVSAVIFTTRKMLLPEVEQFISVRLDLWIKVSPMAL